MADEPEEIVRVIKTTLATFVSLAVVAGIIWTMVYKPDIFSLVTILIVGVLAALGSIAFWWDKFED